MIEQNRFRSWALRASIGALAVFCAKEFVDAELGSALDGLLNVLLPVFAAFGIINNPTSRNTL